MRNNVKLTISKCLVAKFETYIVSYQKIVREPGMGYTS